MKLISADASPFARKVRVLVHETGLTDRIEVVTVSTTPLNTDPEVASANPMGKIPALLRDDGPALYDSRVITRYLDDMVQAGLYPASRLWEVLTLEATADAMMEAALLMVYERRVRSDAQVSDEWIEAQWAKITRALDALEARWMSHLSGPLDMGQVAVACALGYLDFRHGARGWREGREALARWYERFAARDSMGATHPV
ncbi:glutathione S-transferase [Roseovarius sp. SCSIO 43702]|uniref:glutathione S-transferase n=1 Tax=Roseovarius sp. SCSIO 43702 TaxID=2823043 RepID=UPI001C72E96E|nr:glutathione S-transferase [Roseovarius sp. SCSIO 43702]QYX57677.1 glutathione S-transferase [Roseovarius sp. SCSIO 43702]